MYVDFKYLSQSFIPFVTVPSILFLVRDSIIPRPLHQDLLAVSGLSACWWLPGRVHPCPAALHVFNSMRMQQMAYILVWKLGVVCFEHWCAMASPVWIDVIFLLGWVIVHIVEPSLPARCYLLDPSWEGPPVVGVFYPPPLILILMRDVLVVTVAERILSNHWYDLVSEACLFVSRSIRLASEDCAHKALLSV